MNFVDKYLLEVNKLENTLGLPKICITDLNTLCNPTSQLLVHDRPTGNDLKQTTKKHKWPTSCHNPAEHNLNKVHRPRHHHDSSLKIAKPRGDRAIPVQERTICTRSCTRKNKVEGGDGNGKLANKKVSDEGNKKLANKNVSNEGNRRVPVDNENVTDKEINLQIINSKVLNMSVEYKNDDIVRSRCRRKDVNNKPVAKHSSKVEQYHPVKCKNLSKRATSRSRRKDEKSPSVSSSSKHQIGLMTAKDNHLKNANANAAFKPESKVHNTPPESCKAPVLDTFYAKNKKLMIEKETNLSAKKSGKTRPDKTSAVTVSQSKNRKEKKKTQNVTEKSQGYKTLESDLPLESVKYKKGRRQRGKTLKYLKERHNILKDHLNESKSDDDLFESSFGKNRKNVCGLFSESLAEPIVIKTPREKDKTTGLSSAITPRTALLTEWGKNTSTSVVPFTPTDPLRAEKEKGALQVIYHHMNGKNPVRKRKRKSPKEPAPLKRSFYEFPVFSDRPLQKGNDSSFDDYFDDAV